MAARTTKPKAGTDALPEDNEKYGQVVSRTDQGRPFVVSNRFSASHVEMRGRELLALAPINHVGPAPILVPMAELDELIADLIALQNAPGPDDENSRSNDA